MSKPTNFQDVPNPHSSVAGQSLTDTSGPTSPRKQASKYRPRGVKDEPLLATMARMAVRLIDRTTGKAYSVDELAALINAGEVYVTNATVLAALGFTPMPADGAPVSSGAALGVASREIDLATGMYQSVAFTDASGVRTLTMKVTNIEPPDGQRLYLRVTTLASGGTLKLGAGIAIPSISTTPWDTDGLALAASKSFELLLRYNTTINKWCFLSFTGGFA